MTDRHECSVGPADEATSRIDQIADAALRRFSRYGYKRSSMDDVAREAGLAKATLYLHFKGKEEVFRAMIQRFGTRVAARCREVLEREGPFEVRLAALLEAHFGTAFAAFGAGEHLPELKAVMTVVAASEIEAFEGIFSAALRQLLAQAEAKGEIVLSPLGPDAVIATLLQAAIGAKTGSAPTREAYGERLRQFAAVVAAAVRPR
jgi:AcrR family transcriptional regulator